MTIVLFHTIRECTASRAGRGVLLSTAVLTISACSRGPDNLRSDIPPTGIAATVQIDLPNDSQQAQVAATVYKNAAAQPLVGGDVLQARTDQSLATLRALDSLDGHYTGALVVDHPDSAVDVAVNYDQEASAEDRWFASDDLLVNPGPGSLVGYGVTGMTFPPAIAFESPAEGARYFTSSDTITVNWTSANDGDQVRMTAAVACTSGARTYRYGLAHNIGFEQDGAATGTYTLTVGELVDAAPFLVTLGNVVEYVSVLVTAVALGIDPTLLLNNTEQLTQPAEIDRCDIDLTLFREHDNPLPASFSGGYAITSRSDSIRIAYVPE